MAAGNRFITDLRNNFRRGDIVTRLLYLNVGIFLCVSVVNVILTLFRLPAGRWADWLVLPAYIPGFLSRPWTLLTYMFMHAGLLHILFNMLWLYWFGRLFLQLFSSRHLRGLYILGGLFGGIAYLVSYNIFPYFEPYLPVAHVLGASASVLAIVVATAVRAPQYRVQFMFIGSVSLKYLALVMVVIDMLFMTSDNAGGHIAHLGGALAGWWFAAGLTKGYDLTDWINRIIDGLNRLFKPAARKPKMTIHASGRSRDYAYNARKKANTEEIDRILDKLRKSGYASLSEREKKSLFDASKK